MIDAHSKKPGRTYKNALWTVGVHWSKDTLPTKEEPAGGEVEGVPARKMSKQVRRTGKITW